MYTLDELSSVRLADPYWLYRYSHIESVDKSRDSHTNRVDSTPEQDTSKQDPCYNPLQHEVSCYTQIHTHVDISNNGLIWQPYCTMEQKLYDYTLLDEIIKDSTLEFKVDMWDQRNMQCIINVFLICLTNILQGMLDGTGWRVIYLANEYIYRSNVYIPTHTNPHCRWLFSKDMTEVEVYLGNIITSCSHLNETQGAAQSAPNFSSAGAQRNSRDSHKTSHRHSNKNSHRKTHIWSLCSVDSLSVVPHCINCASAGIFRTHYINCTLDYLRRIRSKDISQIISDRRGCCGNCPFPLACLLITGTFAELVTLVDTATVNPRYGYVGVSANRFLLMLVVALWNFKYFLSTANMLQEDNRQPGCSFEALQDHLLLEDLEWFLPHCTAHFFVLKLFNEDGNFIFIKCPRTKCYRDVLLKCYFHKLKDSTLDVDDIAIAKTEVEEAKKAFEKARDDFETTQEDLIKAYKKHTGTSRSPWQLKKFVWSAEVNVRSARRTLRIARRNLKFEKKQELTVLENHKNGNTKHGDTLCKYLLPGADVVEHNGVIYWKMPMYMKLRGLVEETDWKSEALRRLCKLAEHLEKVSNLTGEDGKVIGLFHNDMRPSNVARLEGSEDPFFIDWDLAGDTPCLLTKDVLLNFIYCSYGEGDIFEDFSLFANELIESFLNSFTYSRAGTSNLGRDFLWEGLVPHLESLYFSFTSVTPNKI
eukprot:GHVR01084801.1.p1 GENE.GHVR01084801.1~~GHVR01084801.1.p1  ORF type:complete len:762 (+),score=93.74 GHVR01084801.1:182-2287(+)